MSELYLRVVLVVADLQLRNVFYYSESFVVLDSVPCVVVCACFLGHFEC